MKKAFSALLGIALLVAALSGCASTEGSSESSAGSEESGSVAQTEETQSQSEEAQETELQTDADMFTDRDYESDYDESDSVLIELDGDSASSSSNSVKISGTTVTITEEATYIISGSLDDGMIIVDASDSAKIQLVLNGVDITSESSAALYILEADKVFITLAEGTENYLTNGGEFVAIDDNNIDGALFSKQDLTLNGSGSLTVTSPAGHGIVCKDDLVITGGNYIISSASHGLDANDSIRVTGETTLTIDAGKDGLHAENDDDESLGFVYISGGDFEIEAEGDGISAGYYMQITEGNFKIVAGGGNENAEQESSDFWGGFQNGRGGAQSMETTSTSSEDSTSMKGIKADGDLTITGGSFTIDSADDSLHSNSSITVNGGSFELASGDDAFHADDTLTVTDGVINISTSYEGMEALHVDIQGGEISIVATDDGLNAAGGNDSSGTTGGRDGMFGGGMWNDGSSSYEGTIVISGGSIYINASGDGLDANGTIEISGGEIISAGPTQGDTTVLDYDASATITGGTFFGTGASSMAQSFSESEQGVIAVSVGTQEAGSTVTITDADGNVLWSYEPELAYEIVIFSSPDIVSGESYTITAGTVSGETEAS